MKLTLSSPLKASEGMAVLECYASVATVAVEVFLGGMKFHRSLPSPFPILLGLGVAAMGVHEWRQGFR